MSFTYNNPKLKTIRRKLRKDQTNVERLLWSRLRNKQILGRKFYRQYSIDSFIVDFYCPVERLAIELDGGQHKERKHKVYDKERSQYLINKGITILRFWDNDVLKNINGVLEVILSEMI